VGERPAKFYARGVKLVQSFGEQRQRDRSDEDEESGPRRLREPPECVDEDSSGEARGGFSLVSRRDRNEDRHSRSGEKRVRIALGQQLAGPLADFGADENELGMQLPRLRVPIRGRLVLVDAFFLEPKDCRPSADGAKAGFEPGFGFDGDSGQITTGYRRTASPA
jgi:hypothetical protein